jgi:hypothetical protein
VSQQRATPSAAQSRQEAGTPGCIESAACSCGGLDQPLGETSVKPRRKLGRARWQSEGESLLGGDWTQGMTSRRANQTPSHGEGERQDMPKASQLDTPTTPSWIGPWGAAQIRRQAGAREVWTVCVGGSSGVLQPQPALALCRPVSECPRRGTNIASGAASPTHGCPQIDTKGRHGAAGSYTVSLRLATPAHGWT